MGKIFLNLWVDCRSLLSSNRWVSCPFSEHEFYLDTVRSIASIKRRIIVVSSLLNFLFFFVFQITHDRSSSLKGKVSYDFYNTFPCLIFKKYILLFVSYASYPYVVISRWRWRSPVYHLLNTERHCFNSAKDCLRHRVPWDDEPSQIRIFALGY